MMSPPDDDVRDTQRDTKKKQRVVYWHQKLQNTDRDQLYYFIIMVFFVMLCYVMLYIFDVMLCMLCIVI